MMAPKTSSSSKPAAAGKAKSTAVKKEPKTNTRKRLARMGFSALDDECTKRLMEALVEQYPESLKEKWETFKTSTTGKRELKPLNFLDKLTIEPLTTLLGWLYGEKYMPIINQARSLNGAEYVLAQILTDYWSRQEPFPVSEVPDLFGREGNQKTFLRRIFKVNNGLRAWPPEQAKLGCPADDKGNESHVDQQEQKAPGLSCATHQGPKTEVLGMEEQSETQVKEEQTYTPYSQQEMTDDDCDEEDKKMLLQDNKAEEVDQHAQDEIKEQDESKEDSGCCPANEDAAAGELCVPSCSNYDVSDTAALLWQGPFITCCVWQSQQSCYKMMMQYEVVFGAEESLPNLCNMKDEPVMKDEPAMTDDPMMTDDEQNTDGDDDFMKYDDCSSDFTAVEGDPWQFLMSDSFNTGEHMYTDCSDGGVVEGVQPQPQMILDVLPSSQSQQPPNLGAYS